MIDLEEMLDAKTVFPQIAELLDLLEENPWIMEFLVKVAENQRNGKPRARRTYKRRDRSAAGCETTLSQEYAEQKAATPEALGDASEEKPKRRPGRPRTKPVPEATWNAARRAEEAKEAASSTP